MWPRASLRWIPIPQGGRCPIAGGACASSRPSGAPGGRVVLTPQEVEQHWAYRLTRWGLDHGEQLLVAGLVLCVLLLALSTAYLWFFQGARIIAAGWVWQQFLRGLRRPEGMGAGGHSALYEATLRSPEWHRVRRETIRQQGRRCAWCGGGGRLDVHHLTYTRLGRELPGDVVALCPTCHATAHSRG